MKEKEYRIKEITKDAARKLLCQSIEDIYAIYVDKTTGEPKTLTLSKITDCSVKEIRKIFNIESSTEVCEVRFFTMEYVPEIKYND